MITRKSIIISGSKKNDILIDIKFKKNNLKKKVVIFSHGFKGFKDWGPFNNISETFANNNFVFVKFNFSYNGTTINHPIDFNDLKSFAENNFSIELDDLNEVINWVITNDELIDNIDINSISLFGHSRGGAISILKTQEDSRINKVVSWASPCDFTNIMDEKKIKAWKDNGFVYVYNSRTNQNMPLNYQFYEDSLKNIDRINIKNSVINIKIPILIIHGDNDTSVSVDSARIMKKWNNNLELYIIKDANHVFNAKHPFYDDKYPHHLLEAINKTMNFLKL
ncbi:prolyl oligopeptidase family serine peptidase [Flavobacteriales bacterium]|nr:prolyl oligopeptidase family serine peptidase [Flavobacteriales bacterium]